MSTSETAGPGLRERKKQQTREALSWAALRLAVDRGLSNVLVEDIAAEAGVSPRTYNNYFSSKAEAITWRHLNRARRTADLLRERPSGEPLWESIMRAVVAQAGGERASPEPEWIAGVRLMLSEPELQGEFLKASVAAERECAAADRRADRHRSWPGHVPVAGGRRGQRGHPGGQRAVAAGRAAGAARPVAA